MDEDEDVNGGTVYGAGSVSEPRRPSHSQVDELQTVRRLDLKNIVLGLKKKRKKQWNL